MPSKEHNEVLVFKKTVWISMEDDTQRWRVYKRRLGYKGRHPEWAKWWLGLIPQGYIEGNVDIPQPLLKGYASISPHGTDLWIQGGGCGYEMWHSSLNLEEVLKSEKPNKHWEYIGLVLLTPRVLQSLCEQ